MRVFAFKEFENCGELRFKRLVPRELADETSLQLTSSRGCIVYD